MESLFYIEQRFNPFVAKKYGVNEAVFIQKIIELQLYNAASGLNCRSGRYWVKSSRSGITKVFIFWTERQVQNLTEKLKDKGVLHIENFNPEKTDRTLWYSVSDEALQMYNLSGGQFENFAKYGLNMNPAIQQNGKMDLTHVLNGSNQSVKTKENTQLTETHYLTDSLNGDKIVKSQLSEVQDLTGMLNVYSIIDNNNIPSLIKEEETKEKKTYKEKKSRPVREPEKTDLHNRAKLAFCEFYKRKTGEEYYWTAADAGSLEQLLKKQKARLEQKKLDSGNEMILTALSTFFDAVPAWYLEKLSIKILNSSYNAIISEISKISKDAKKNPEKVTGDKMGINVTEIEH